MAASARIPYFSQWSDPSFNEAIIAGADPCSDPTWHSAGFANADAYRFWSRRICGIACLKSILAAYNMDVPSSFDLLSKALASGAYRLRANGTIEGLIYRPFTEMISEEFDLASSIITDINALDIATIIPSNGFLIWSVSSEIRMPIRPNERKGGHLVLIFSANEETCVFHNPSGINPFKANVEISIPTLARFSAGRGIAIKRSVS